MTLAYDLGYTTGPFVVAIAIAYAIWPTAKIWKIPGQVFAWVKGKLKPTTPPPEDPKPSSVPDGKKG